MLAAAIRHLEAKAIDGALDLFQILMATRLRNVAKRKADKERLSTLPQLEKASRTLARAAKALSRNALPAPARQKASVKPLLPREVDDKLTPPEWRSEQRSDDRKGASWSRSHSRTPSLSGWWPTAYSTDPPAPATRDGNPATPPTPRPNRSAECPLPAQLTACLQSHLLPISPASATSARCRNTSTRRSVKAWSTGSAVIRTRW